MYPMSPKICMHVFQIHFMYNKTNHAMKHSTTWIGNCAKNLKCFKIVCYVSAPVCWYLFLCQMSVDLKTLPLFCIVHASCLKPAH